MLFKSHVREYLVEKYSEQDENGQWHHVKVYAKVKDPSNKTNLLIEKYVDGKLENL